MVTLLTISCHKLSALIASHLKLTISGNMTAPAATVIAAIRTSMAPLKNRIIFWINKRETIKRSIANAIPLALPPNLRDRVFNCLLILPKKQWSETFFQHGSTSKE